MNAIAKLKFQLITRAVLLLAMMWLIPIACSTTAEQESTVEGPLAAHPMTMDMGQTPHNNVYEIPKALDLNALSDLDGIIPTLASRRVVFVGETHNRFDHHLNQLEIIRRLHQIHPDLAIGMEFFQQPFQPYLDEFVAGNLSEDEFLKRTEYYERWKYDYRLYRPILEYARDNNIPLIALNVPREITEKVGASGIAQLSAEDKKAIPKEIDRSDEVYRERLNSVFKMHPHSDQKNFEHFLEAQLLWDEGMAERAAQFLKENPDKHMVILAGSGHLTYGSGIPKRLIRRTNVSSAIVLNAGLGDIDPDMADFVLLPKRVDLPPKGLLGIMMTDTEEGVTVGEFSEQSAAKEKGMKKGDRIVALDGKPVKSSADVQIGMLDKQPGDRVQLELRRTGQAKSSEEITMEVSLR